MRWLFLIFILRIARGSNPSVKLLTCSGVTIQRPRLAAPQSIMKKPLDLGRGAQISLFKR